MKIDESVIKGCNPYLPSWEYIPDGEPHVFGDRVYVYGSHDFFNGYEFCPGDYLCYSASVTDLSDWRCEGTIFGRRDDPRNKNGEQCLYAPDVTCGQDGKYYLYYCLNKEHVISVAVSDTPAGRYEFLGYVRHGDGTLLGERAGDAPQFDPGVITEGGFTYIYTGFNEGAMCSVLKPDMLELEKEPVYIVPSGAKAANTSFSEHPFFEASSIRKISGKYYFIYSSQLSHELCYAVSDCPDRGFVFKGTLVSNIDVGIGTYKPALAPMGWPDNNHGSVEFINGRYYVFYHRHTNNCSFSRQGCIEPVNILPDGTIPQAEMTSGGARGALPGIGVYPAFMACNLYRPNTGNVVKPGAPGVKRDPGNPYITQDGRDGDENYGYIENFMDGAVAGFKYFECKGTVISKIYARLNFSSGMKLEVLTDLGGTPIGSVELNAPHGFEDGWGVYDTEISLPDGINAIYFRAVGNGRASFGGFELAGR